METLYTTAAHPTLSNPETKGHKKANITDRFVASVMSVLFLCFSCVRWFVFLFVCLFLCLILCLFLCLVCFVSLVYLFVRLVGLVVWFVSLFVCVFVCLYQFVCKFVCFVCLFFSFFQLLLCLAANNFVGVCLLGFIAAS